LIGGLSDQQCEFITDIYTSGNHLLALINDILDLSKVEAGKMELDLEPVPVHSLFAESLSIIREKAAERRIALDLAADENLGDVEVDVRKVKQMLYNLLANAVKFANEGGHVTLRASRVSRADVGQTSGAWAARSFPLAESDHADFLRISVSDDGIGISAEGLQQLFQPFSQIDSGLARKFQGTGLGLAMVKLLAELHGGAVAMESAVGEGTRVTLWLPVRPGGAATLAPPDVPDRLTTEVLQSRTALVVEGDSRSAELIQLQLEAEGFTVMHAASAEAALALAVQQPLSLITLDILLPGMDGWEFLAQLKRTPVLRAVPVLILSIVADPTKGFSLGAAAVLQKPISRQDLYESLVDAGLFPLADGKSLKVLVVDDDPKAVELTALRVGGMASAVLRAYGGRDAIEMARRERPDVILLDLMMPEVSGFDVVAALHDDVHTADIPIIVITAKQVTAEDRAQLNGYVIAIMEKGNFGPGRFSAEVRRAMAGRKVA
jgi:CheY-like chemotaxis protein